mgnify:FL=1
MIRGINFKSDDEKDKVISLWYQAALNEYNFLPIDYFKNESKILYDNLDLQNILVCEYKDDILGFVGMIDKECISYLYVDTLYQHRGIGTALLNELKKNHSILEVKVFKEANSINFFTDNDFKIVREDEDTKTGQKIYYMKWINKGVENEKIFNS